jgi:hypothetical protein
MTGHARRTPVSALHCTHGVPDLRPPCPRSTPAGTEPRGALLD